jgi:hypothetical protein
MTNEQIAIHILAGLCVLLLIGNGVHMWIHRNRLVDLRELKGFKDLIKHCWVHSGYHDCGYLHMTTPQKNLYNKIIGRTPNETMEIYGFVPMSNEDFEKTLGL